MFYLYQYNNRYQGRNNSQKVGCPIFFIWTKNVINTGLINNFMVMTNILLVCFEDSSTIDNLEVGVHRILGGFQTPYILLRLCSVIYLLYIVLFKLFYLKNVIKYIHFYSIEAFICTNDIFKWNSPNEWWDVLILEFRILRVYRIIIFYHTLLCAAYNVYIYYLIFFFVYNKLFINYYYYLLNIKLTSEL